MTMQNFHFTGDQRRGEINAAEDSEPHHRTDGRTGEGERTHLASLLEVGMGIYPELTGRKESTILWT